MWNGKMKAVTLSYDDGVAQDIRLIELLDRYGLRATFNLNPDRQRAEDVFSKHLYRPRGGDCPGGGHALCAHLHPDGAL